MRSDAHVRGIRGPVGSGKSVGMCVEIFRRALAQPPDKSGIRRSRWAVIRNTNPQLETTTMATWKDWFPEEVWGKIRMHPPPYRHRLRKGDLDLEVLFIALDKPDDVRKLLSLELTGVFINEAREVPKEIVDACTMRVGRYPRKIDGGAGWYGVIMDTNAPDEDHWWSIMAGDAPVPERFTKEEALMLQKPPGWEFFEQPPGMLEQFDGEGNVIGYEINPKAENLDNLPEGYYERVITGKDRQWINVYVLNRIGDLQDGKPVYPEWNSSLHLATERLEPVPGVPIHVGIDFGLTPAAVFVQQVHGRWVVLHELVAFDMGAARFGPELKREMALFPDNTFIIWGDPSGDYRVGTDERTPFQVLRAQGIMVRPAPTNDPSVRIDAVKGPLGRLIDKASGFVLSPHCTYLKRGFDGGYQYKRLNVSGSARFSESPDKNKFSHVHDALQYALCGGGEARTLLYGSSSKGEARVMKPRPNPFSFIKRKSRSKGFGL